MSAVTWPEGGSSALQRVITEKRPAATSDVRTIRVGIVGLGQVGQAVARLVPAATRLAESGLRFRVLGALVRDIERQRRCPKPARLTTNPAAFLRGNYDVVIEALGAIEPARSIVGRLLGRGVPVVTANKALVAAHGTALAALAARRGTAFRYEASALAGVPFFGALAARPLVSDVQRLATVVNGTSNFILSKLDAERCAFATALAEAQALGLTEPDPSRDLDGLDAADKLALLASLFGWGPVAKGAEVLGIRAITPHDLAAARSIGATIKPLVWAAQTPTAISAFIGPALVPARHPLASLAGTLSGIQLSGRFVTDLFFSGPGAGPDITAATILDDAVEAVSMVPKLPRAARRAGAGGVIEAPETEWFVRGRFPGFVPDASAVRDAFNSRGLQVRHVTDAVDDTRWLVLEKTSRGRVTEALETLRVTNRIRTFAIRALQS